MPLSFTLSLYRPYISLSLSLLYLPPCLYLTLYLSLYPTLSLLFIILFGVSNGRFRPCYLCNICSFFLAPNRPSRPSTYIYIYINFIFRYMVGGEEKEILNFDGWVPTGDIVAYNNGRYWVRGKLGIKGIQVDGSVLNSAELG